MKALLAAIAICFLALIASPSSFAQEPVTTSIVTVECPMTGPGVAACATAALVLYELIKAANGEEAFGPNGEVMKLLAAPINTIDGNVKGAERESGDLDKLLRATLGISLADIRTYGLCGGPNSEARKLLGCR
jgi:hypothetical protein